MEHQLLQFKRFSLFISDPFSGEFNGGYINAMSIDPELELAAMLPPDTLSPPKDARTCMS